MKEYNPESLPEPDAVEIVDLRRLNADHVSQYMQMADDEPSVCCKGPSAREFAAAWRALVPGESARCHTPPVGIRFIAVGETALEASICWKCNNLFGTAGGSEIAYAFDAESEPARRLFSLAQQLIGSDIPGEG